MYFICFLNIHFVLNDFILFVVQYEYDLLQKLYFYNIFLIDYVQLASESVVN